MVKQNEIKNFFADVASQSAALLEKMPKSNDADNIKARYSVASIGKLAKIFYRGATLWAK